MTRTRVLLLVCFVVTFAAGTTAGLVAGKSELAADRTDLAGSKSDPGMGRPHEGRPRDHRSWLTAELNLTPEQQDRMRAIWSQVMEGSMQQEWEQRKAISDKRDKAILALLTPEQRPDYEQILQECRDDLENLAQQRRLAFEQAVEGTKQILTPDQAKQYEELLKKQRERGFGGPPGSGPPPRPDGPRGGRFGPRSRPTSDEHRTPRGGE
jgi:Spy/CpxP family protein refolding chaperone